MGAVWNYWRAVVVKVSNMLCVFCVNVHVLFVETYYK